MKSVMFESYVLNYIFIGLVFLTIIEILSSLSKEKKDFGLVERLIIAIFWPLSLMIFSIAFLYGLFSQIIKGINKK